MSLINEALKKARDKSATPSAPPPAPAPAPARPLSSPPPKSVSGGLWAVAALAVSGFGALFWVAVFMQVRPTKVPQQAAVSAPVASASAPASPRLAPSDAPAPTDSLPPPAPSGVTSSAPSSAGSAAGSAPPLQSVAQPPPGQTPAVAASRLPRPPLRLTATMVFDNSRSAIINGERVREGDEVEGATVLEIDLEGVRLRFNGEEFFLRMK